MNSYLRATLNARDVRTAYNVLNQYRLLVEAMLRQTERQAAALEGVRHMNYYGHVSFDMKLRSSPRRSPTTCRRCASSRTSSSSPEEEEMLAQFLELDRPLRVQQPGERAARRAQGAGQARRLLPGAAAKRTKARADLARHAATSRRERLLAIRARSSA